VLLCVEVHSSRYLLVASTGRFTRLQARCCSLCTSKEGLSPLPQAVCLYAARCTKQPSKEGPRDDTTVNPPESTHCTLSEADPRREIRYICDVGIVQYRQISQASQRYNSQYSLQRPQLCFLNIKFILLDSSGEEASVHGGGGSCASFSFCITRVP
jgi:hypothetical protein